MVAECSLRLESSSSVAWQMPLEDMDDDDGTAAVQRIGRLIDNKLRISPEIFKGELRLWQERSTIFRANIVGLSEELADAMELAELNDHVMRKEDLPQLIAENAWGFNAQLRAALVAYTRDKAQGLVLGVADRKNGLEAWRVLYHRYCKGGLSHSSGLMQAILGFDFSGDDFIDKLIQWEDLIGSYDKLQEVGEEMPDKIKHAVLLMRTPKQTFDGECKSHHQVHRHEDYH